MTKELEKINSFVTKHHVMSLATNNLAELSVCSLFYTFSLEKLSFIVASNEETTHIEHIKENSTIAGNILLETKVIGKIQGVQFRGEFVKLQDSELEELYFKEFAHARVMKPALWQIKVKYFKMTDNTFGFGKKIIWQEASA